MAAGNCGASILESIRRKRDTCAKYAASQQSAPALAAKTSRWAGGVHAYPLLVSKSNLPGDRMTELLDPALLAPIEKVAQFIETGDESLLSAFASQGVVIIENFAPHLFEGEDAVKRWRTGVPSENGKMPRSPSKTYPTFCGLHAELPKASMGMSRASGQPPPPAIRRKSASMSSWRRGYFSTAKRAIR
ncbi:hypothetical protein LSAC_00485 [Levilinea saccharolytica]|nr:hypothetical protein LSAC_00485 [Levilinea saccharolytica]